jgi:hypothetical protein
MTNELEHLKLIVAQQRKEIERLRVEVNRATGAAICAIWERSQETALRTMVEGMIMERHAEFHKQHDHDWKKCSNKVCVSAKLLLEHERAQEIEITHFGLTIIQEFMLKVSYGRRPDTGALEWIKAKLVKRSELPKDAPQEQPNIILSDS